MTTENKLIDRRNELVKEIKLLKKELKLEQNYTNKYIKRFHDAEEEIKKLRALRSDIIAALSRPITTSDEGLLLYIRDEVDCNTRQANRITKLEAELAEMHKCALEVTGFLAEKKNLEDKIKELKESLKNEKEWVSQYQKWLIEEVAEGMSENGFADDDLRQKARDRLILDGKIGTDADAKSRVWKITKDRVDALKGEINGYDIYDNDIETHSLKMRRKNVLKTMLKEATD